MSSRVRHTKIPPDTSASTRSSLLESTTSGISSVQHNKTIGSALEGTEGRPSYASTASSDPQEKDVPFAIVDTPASQKPIIDIQQMGQAPNQTFYQLVVFPTDLAFSSTDAEDNSISSKPGSNPIGGVTKKRVQASSEAQRLASTNSSVQRKGGVVLRDWPRKRISQNWNRSGMLNPGQRVFSYKEFLSGELKDEVIAIFGRDQYQVVVNKIKEVTHEK